MTTDYLIKRDNEVVKAGGFFCHACLVGKPRDDASPDPRYCLGCYDYLAKEAETLPAGKRPAWIPKKPEIAGEKPIPVSQHGVLNMSTLDNKKIEVDIIHPPARVSAIGKRGPKHRDLPEDFIKRLASEGMGSKAIATRLKVEGIGVSYKTIQRILSGQRVLV